MIKRDITETVYEYDKEGKLVKKTVTETHEEENNTVTTYPSWIYSNGSTTTPCTLTNQVADANSIQGTLTGVTITG